MKEQYGEFSRQGNEYIINRPDTPKPWVNLLSNGFITSQISQVGQGGITDLQTGEPITRQGTTELLPHLPARRLYLRDNDTGHFWNLTGQLASMPLEHFEASHALDSTRINLTCEEIDSSITFFLAPTDPCEIWQVKIRNSAARKRRLSLFAAVEWQSAGQDREQTASHETVLTRHPRTGVESQLPVSFFACDRAIDSFDTFEDVFLGRQQSYLAPEAVVDGQCSRSQGSGGRPIAVLQKNITLGGETTSDVSFLLGRVRGKGKTIPVAAAHALTEIKKLVSHYRQTGEVEASWTETHRLQEERTQQNLVKSPDPILDYFLNYWAKHQTTVSRPVVSGNAASQLEQILSLVANDQARAAALLIDIFARQQKDGRLRLDDSQADSSQRLIAATLAYLKETGDLTFLEGHVDYEDSGAGSVLQHITRALDGATNRLTRRHLPISPTPRLLNTSEEAEEQSYACGLYQNLRELTPFLDAVGEHEQVQKYDRIARHLREAINEHFWLDSWYGSQIIGGHRQSGFKRNTEHKIGLAEQAWAVVAGVASQDQGSRSLAAAKAHLLTKYGYRSLSPSYTQQTDNRNSVTQPGSEMNGGINLADNALAVSAWALIGDGDEAYRLFQTTCPGYLAARPDYRAEPFAYADFIYGPDHRLFGQGENWQTGSSASWFSVALWQHVLGIQPVLGGLKIDPCLPRDWRKVELTRRFRGGEYHIRILNTLRQNRGVDRILVDGVRITGSVIPTHGTGVHFVEVVLG